MCTYINVLFVLVFIIIIQVTVLLLLFSRFYFIACINPSPSYYRRRRDGSHMILNIYTVIHHRKDDFRFRIGRRQTIASIVLYPTDLERYLPSPVMVYGTFLNFASYHRAAQKLRPR